MDVSRYANCFAAFLLVYVFMLPAKLSQSQGSTGVCDTSIPCSCCADDPIDPVNCFADFKCKFTCKDGYWGERCLDQCPSTCISCAQTFGRDNQCAECKTGYYGHKCNRSCSDMCQSCDKTQGACTECNPGYFGSNCAKTCPPNCNNSSCIHDTGYCFQCQNGTYGTWCNETCPSNCLGNFCNQNTGFCNNCVSKFTGDTCNTCINGSYGQSCEKTCSPYCKYGTCDREKGTCTYGCINDFSDSQFCCLNNSFCNRCNSSFECDSCVDGMYGGKCESSCPVNCNKSCERNSGVCFGCSVNYYGSKCENACSESCSRYNNSFSSCSNNGTCLYGCEPFHHGIKCDQLCPQNCLESCERNTGYCLHCKPDFYGTYCESNCSESCLIQNVSMSSCIKDNGTCIYGCIPLYYDSKCDLKCPQNCFDSCERYTGNCQTCKQNFHGTKCENICSETCLESNASASRCTKEDGVCQFGCETHTYGDTCEKRCPTFCNGSCDRHNGNCFSCRLYRFGHVCENICPETCLAVRNEMEVCFSQNGTCLLGCNHRYSAGFCTERCSDVCHFNTCDITRNECIDRCAEAIGGLYCNQEESITSRNNTPDSTIPIIAVTFFIVSIGIGITVTLVLMRNRFRLCGKRDTGDVPSESNDAQPGMQTTYEHLDQNARNADPSYSMIFGNNAIADTGNNMLTTYEDLNPTTRNTDDSYCVMTGKAAEQRDDPTYINMIVSSDI